MKTKHVTLFCFLMFGLYAKAQNYPRLNVIFKKDFNTKSNIYIEPIIADNVFVVEYLTASMKTEGFNLVMDEKKADYVIKIVYKSRNDMGCNGSVIKKMDGRIIDPKGETIVLFNFGQSSLEGKCTKDVMNGLAHKLKTEYLKK